MTEPFSTISADAATEGTGDLTAAALTVLGFSLSMGVGMLALPLLALAAGYDAAMVGGFAAVSAVGQLVFRLILPWLLRRYSDRNLLRVAFAMFVCCYALLFASTAAPVFVLAQLLQGSGRALFWTSVQTHAVREPGAAVHSLARVQIVGNVGTMIGPAAAGIVLSVSLDLALALGMVTALLGGVFSSGMRNFPPFVRMRRQPGESRIWRRTDVVVGCWATFAAGGWRALLGSYFPVVLTEAGLAFALVGALLALADAASFGVAAVLVRYAPLASLYVIGGGVVVTALGIVSLPFLAMHVGGAAAAIVVGGAGAGLLATLGPAVVSDSVSPNERGDAIAIAGTFRAIALFATPTGVAIGLSIATLPVSVAIVGAVFALPTLAIGVGAHVRRATSPS